MSKEIQPEGVTRLVRAYEAAVEFIESSVADPDITPKMALRYAQYQDRKMMLEDWQREHGPIMQ